MLRSQDVTIARANRWIGGVALAICVTAMLTVRVGTAADPASDSKAIAATSASPEKSAASASEKPATVSTIPQVEYINQYIRKGWQDAQVMPSQLANDGEWCRRVFLDVLGRVPSVVELNQYLADKSGNKKRNLVERLLATDPNVKAPNGTPYLTEYTRNWSNIWSLLLVGRPPAQNPQRDPVNREGMAQWLRRSFQTNKKYDQFVYELVTATGNNTPGTDSKDFNGAVNFLTGKMEENGVQATAKTAQIFLGLQVQCTQCHNHPFNDYKQNQFWEMNAFFRQTKANRNGTRRMVESVDLTDVDFNGESKNKSQADLFYELRNGVLRVAYPVFVDGKEDAKWKNGSVKELNRRDELGKLIRNSVLMDKTMVNRMWAHFFGYGFTKPIDDMGPHNPPTHPELLEKLAADFRLHSHDVKELMKWIILSEPYAISAKFNAKNRQDDPLLGERPLFSHFYLRQMRAEQLYESLLVATEADGGKDEVARDIQRADWLRQFTVAFGTDENDDTTTFNGTIPQALMMMNGDLTKKAISTSDGSFLAKVANSSSSPADKINALYMAALSRRPSNAELNSANAALMMKKGNTAAALQDVFWAILNSNEFILQH